MATKGKTVVERKVNNQGHLSLKRRVLRGFRTFEEV